MKRKKYLILTFLILRLFLKQYILSAINYGEIYILRISRIYQNLFINYLFIFYENIENTLYNQYVQNYCLDISASLIKDNFT